MAVVGAHRSAGQARSPLQAEILRASRDVVLRATAVQAVDPQWERVEKLAPGARITLRAGVAARAPRVFVRADDASVTVLSLVGLPRRAREAVLSMAAQAPTRVSSVGTGAVQLRDRSIVLRADGLFDGPTKIAELQSVVETVPRSAVAEISVRSAQGSARGAAIGAAIGVAAGYLTYGAFAASDAPCGGCSTNIAATAFTAGVAGGAAIGYFAMRPERDAVIYRGPVTQKDR